MNFLKELQLTVIKFHFHLGEVKVCDEHVQLISRTIFAKHANFGGDKMFEKFIPFYEEKNV